ncbi:Hypothetical protein CAP_6552 [Chondromyces apiculatus DSM 436]|uniref:Uncharacterized protein n=1 Tax=Chondromyces apiculatus DSM 436 TaxID=1192034 RepID=A0A017T1D3_9BACT|nr:Hypothetical protein CAP_6552 [Chondromyces apiculatus DSM 436]
MNGVAPQPLRSAPAWKGCSRFPTAPLPRRERRGSRPPPRSATVARASSVASPSMPAVETGGEVLPLHSRGGNGCVGLPLTPQCGWKHGGRSCRRSPSRGGNGCVGDRRRHSRGGNGCVGDRRRRSRRGKGWGGDRRHPFHAEPGLPRETAARPSVAPALVAG